MLVGDDDDNNEGKAAWRDSDDERIIVSLASNPRLRKLRVSEAEDRINGKEYTRRLRRQFEQLYPVPKWANTAPAKTQGHRKRRRNSISSGSSESMASGDDVSLDSEELSTPPLARLLKNAGNFTNSVLSNSSPRKKLQPEIIDVCRTKDVGSAQLVSHCSPSKHTLSSSHSLYPVFGDVASIPSYAPAHFKFWSLFYTLTPSCLSASTKSECFANSSSLTLYLS